jgi:hypothetical protein
VTRPDFEITTSLRARSIRAHVAPEAHTEEEGKGVSITRREERGGLPAQLVPGERFRDVHVAKEVVGERAAAEFETGPGAADTEKV